MERILIADDNKKLVEVLRSYIINAGYDVEEANDGEEALVQLSKGNFDLLLLDIVMPKLDGYEVCKRVRASSDIPIIMITEKGEDFERIFGLNLGADDYIVKPFSIGEVVARIQAVLRRMKKAEEKEKNEIISFDNLRIKRNGYVVQINEKRVELTKREVELLWLLASRSDQVYTREMLLNKLWGFDYFGDMRVVDSHIKRLRNKLADYNHPNWDIKTVWGVGYQFEKKLVEDIPS